MSDGLRQRLRQWLGDSGAKENKPGAEVDIGESAVQPATAPPEMPDRALPDVTGLEKQVVKLGREQFKLNTLLEAQQQQVQAALQQLREQDERRTQDQANLLASHRADLAEARLQVVQRLLPVLDGLDEALGAGERLLARLPVASTPTSQTPVVGSQPLAQPARWAVTLAMPIAWLESLLSVRKLPLATAMPPSHTQPANGDVDEWRTACAGWLRGLSLVRDRFLETLATEGVHPLRAVGQPFDPHWHVVLDTVLASQDAPPGMIVGEARRGYRAGDRVLRYAEVIVSQEPSPQQAPSGEQQRTDRM